MLESATCLKRVFDAYEDAYLGYVIHLSKPPHDDKSKESTWVRVGLLLNFLKYFYKLTLSIFGSSYVTSNIVFHEIIVVDMLLRQWLNGDDHELS